MCPIIALLNCFFGITFAICLFHSIIMFIFKSVPKPIILMGSCPNGTFLGIRSVTGYHVCFLLRKRTPVCTCMSAHIMKSFMCLSTIGIEI